MPLVDRRLRSCRACISDDERAMLVTCSIATRSSSSPSTAIGRVSSVWGEGSVRSGSGGVDAQLASTVKMTAMTLTRHGVLSLARVRWVIMRATQVTLSDCKG